MSIMKKLAVVGSAVLMLESAAFAEVEVTPYGAAQYRLRFQHNQMMPDEGDGYGTFDYSNRLCWRLGTKVNFDDQLSLQFQFGNDWGAANNVNWQANNSPFGPRAGTEHLYAHLAYARWNPGYMFIEAGIIPLNSNGTLDLLANSLNRNDYLYAAFNGWAEMNNSVIGLKIGVPVSEIIGVELTQAIIDNRTQDFISDAPGNPTSMMLDLQIPVNMGAFKITPEVTMVLNRNYNRHASVDAGDHEMLFGLAGSFKANDELTFSFNAGLGIVSNENSQAGTYGGGNGGRSANADEVANFDHYSAKGILVGAGVTYKKLGPGDLQFAVAYGNSENTESDDGATGQIYTDLRYVLKLHERFSFTPRYRTFTNMYTNDDMRLDNRFELILEGSF